MDHLVALPTGRRADDLARLARRIVALGIAVCAPVLVGIWLTDGTDDRWVRWGYPPLAAALLGFAWILVARPTWAARAAVVTLVGIEAWWLVMISGRVAQAPDAATAWASLLPTPLLDVVVCLAVGFLFQRTRTALVHGGIYATLVTVVLAAELGRHPGGTDLFWPSVRYGVYLWVFLGLLLVLSRAKEHFAAAMADVARSDAAAARMREIAHMDELTGIANRRRLVDELGHQAGLVGPDHPVSVLYFDLDHFKQVNDTYGHDVGDQVLRLVAQITAGTVRDGDLPARLGGEEFVVVAPAADHESALALAERLRFALPQGLELEVRLRVTASFGVTQLEPAESADAVLRRVDELMYLAKLGGRDRVQSGAPDVPDRSHSPA
ncbi:GGDEF domain-containing protein [Cellulomonas sp. APG4]|uniref:GGDEF domain-containing protein n=1 Tax=Cellulomonas sp. APG4 TaxID=1538656 RepID=UPI00137A8ADC|nr:GGDEF domain-containing protein [Cellulomonas sp. APG4]NCT90475.1 GGDEF domain-containing protein [Cellulomonas sp. APG4]